MLKKADKMLQIGDRVKSTIDGLYKGVPATVLEVIKDGEVMGIPSWYKVEHGDGKVLDMHVSNLERIEEESEGQ